MTLCIVLKVLYLLLLSQDVSCIDTSVWFGPEPDEFVSSSLLMLDCENLLVLPQNIV